MAKFSNAIKIGSIVIATYEFDKMLAFCQEALHYIADVIVWITKKNIISQFHAMNDFSY